MSRDRKFYLTVAVIYFSTLIIGLMTHDIPSNPGLEKGNEYGCYDARC